MYNGRASSGPLSTLHPLPTKNQLSRCSSTAGSGIAEKMEYDDRKLFVAKMPEEWVEGFVVWVDTTGGAKKTHRAF